jgi:hypothetical protein
MQVGLAQGGHCRIQKPADESQYAATSANDRLRMSFAVTVIPRGFAFNTLVAQCPRRRDPRVRDSQPCPRVASGGCAVQQHAVMRQAKDFYYAVRADTVNHQVAWPGDALLKGHKTTAEPERIDTDPSDFL